MRIKRLEIENFRAITKLALADLQDAVVIAGPNGCGKSCILDAIRLVKSAYGEYQPNELHLWLNEFHVNAAEHPGVLIHLLQRRSVPLRISIELQLVDEEKTWLTAYAQDLLRKEVWKTIAPELAGWTNPLAATLSPRFRERRMEVERQVQEQMQYLSAEINQESHVGSISIDIHGNFEATVSRVLRLVFSTYNPKILGVIDYHGPQRTYSREQLAGINLNTSQIDDQMRQHALYNYAGKYSNIKAALAAGYFREKLLEDAGTTVSGRTRLSETLHELFGAFFPGKQFLGPQPSADGTLEFNVQTDSGAVHDINELSSGEKELLFGYLRLHNTAPRNSILLIDEPELHLNPRLTQGLPEFYHQYLGKAFGNQLWLVTHSDAILRQTVGQAEFSVFHMTSPSIANTNQVREVKAAAEIEQAVIDLVGDLAAYRPGAKIVIFEGGGESEFDVLMVSTLFSDFHSRVNLISGGNRYRVRDLHALLEEASISGSISGRFYSVTDRDFGDELGQPTGRTFSWDRYHIENYLLETEYIWRVVRDLRLAGDLPDIDAVEKALQGSARKTLPALIRIQMESITNRTLVDAIKTRIDHKTDRLADALSAVIDASARRFSEAVTVTLSVERLRDLEMALSNRFGEDLESGAWRLSFRGRDILKRFVGDYLKGTVPYPSFRNLIISRMRDDKFQPLGMKAVLDRILSD